MTSKPRLVTFVGTRPEIIRLSKLIPLLDETFEHIVVHTGQNYDPNLSEVFFSDLNLRSPDIYLDVSRSSLGSSIADIISKAEGVLLDLKPEAVVVLGDTNSALAAFMARRLSIKTYHLEAGNRSFDSRVPEEVNRRLLDHTCDFNLPYSRRAYDNLLSEGLHPNNICLTGSPMPEVIAGQRAAISASTVLEALELEPGHFIVASVHREENVDNREGLGRIISALEAAANYFQLEVVMSTHPRTQKRLDEWQIGMPRNIHAMPPFGINDYLALQSHAFCVVSDSGSVSEESAVLGFPAVTIRDSMERQEALDFGKVLMSGLEAESLIRCISEVTRLSLTNEIPDYSSGDFSSRVIRYILSTIHRGE